MTDAPKKRPWLQFHLSTAVVLMFVAAGLLWLNVQPKTPVIEDGDLALYGCPFDAAHRVYRGAENHPLPDAVLVKPIGFVLDLACGTAVMLAVAAICEWRIRRRERRE